MIQDRSDYILCECPIEKLQAFTSQISAAYQINLLKAPSCCLTMIRAEDSVELQEFYLGEALTTDCEVEVQGKVGYGICLGDEPNRAYCMAIIEALIVLNDDSMPLITTFLTEQLEFIQEKERLAFNQIMRTKVDFKLMEQA